MSFPGKLPRPIGKFLGVADRPPAFRFCGGEQNTPGGTGGSEVNAPFGGGKSKRTSWLSPVGGLSLEFHYLHVFVALE